VISNPQTGVFVFVTVDAQQFPVAAIERVVVVVMVFVVNRQFTNAHRRRIPPAGVPETEPG
jgi:hypothetical protein